MIIHWDGKVICFTMRQGRIVAAFVLMEHTEQSEIEERR